MTSWFRSWHGAPTDTKWLLIARRAGVPPGIVSAVAWALLDYASQQPERGSVDGFDVETYAAFSGFEEADIRAVIEAMTTKEIIVSGRLASWEKRQPEREDNSSERVRRYRESRNAVAVTAGDVTHGNAAKHTVTQRNAPDTDTDTDTDTEKKDILAPTMPTDDLLFDELQKVHPKTIPFKRVFSNTKQRDKWHEVTDMLGIEETQRCIDWCITHEKTTIGAIVNAAQTWHNNNAKARASAPGRNGRSLPAIPAGLPAPEMVWGTVQAEIDRVHYFGTPNLPQPIMSAVEAVGGWYAVCKCDPGGSIPARLRDAYRSAIGA